MKDMPTKSDYEIYLEQALIGITRLLHAHNERFGKVHASLTVLRKAVAELHPDPEETEQELRKLEADAEKIVLENSGFPEAAALMELMKIRKSPDKPDA